MMANERSQQFLDTVAGRDGLFDYSPERSRLLIRVWRALATGRPVTNEQVDGFAADVGLERADADQFLRQMTERDGDDSIVGAMGLSQNDHPHAFTADGVRMTAWCAADTLFLPAMLGKTAVVESESPQSKEPVRLTVGPDGIHDVSPPEAVMSIVLPKETDMSSVAAISMTFCNHILFFSSRDDADQWTGDRDDIEVLSLDESFKLTQTLWAGVLPYATEAVAAR